MTMINILAASGIIKSTLARWLDGNPILTAVIGGVIMYPSIFEAADFNDWFGRFSFRGCKKDLTPSKQNLAAARKISHLRNRIWRPQDRSRSRQIFRFTFYGCSPAQTAWSCSVDRRVRGRVRFL